MRVHLVPSSRNGHDLYCEVPPSAVTDDGQPRGKWRAWVSDVFQRAVAEGEAARTGAAGAPAAPSRLRRAITRKLAETVAEQRLLWQLRRVEDATLVYPDDLSATEAAATRERLLRADRDKHGRWCVVDAGLAALSAPIALVPGPNFFAYYFVFRGVGHYLSMRGAKQGLVTVRWQLEPRAELTSLRHLGTLDRAARSECVRRAEQGLGLERLGALLRHVGEPS